MALRFADGFDQYDTDHLTGWWTQVYDAGILGHDPLVEALIGRRAGRGVRFSSGGSEHGNALAVTLPGANTTAVVGFAFRGVPDAASGNIGWGGASPWTPTGSLYPSGNPSASFAIPFNWLVQVRGGGFCHIAVSLETDGTLSVIRGNTRIATPGVYPEGSVTSLGTTENALYFDNEHYVELKVVLHASAGSVELRVDGDVWLLLEGLRTLQDEVDVTPVTSWTEIAIGRNISAAPNSDWIIDDLYILDGDASDVDNDLVDFLGDVAVLWVSPTADGDVNNWTPASGGLRYAMVDEVPPDDDATYVQSDSAGHVNTFATGGAPLTGATIVAVGVLFLARRVEGGPSSTRPVVRIAGTTYEIGVAKGNTSTYTYQGGFINNQPSDDGPISEADFAAMQPGFKKVT